MYTNKADADRILQFVISEQGFHSLVCPIKCIQLLNGIVTKDEKLKANQSEILFVALYKTLFFVWKRGHCVALLSTVLTQEDVDLESSTDAKKLNEYQLRNSQLEHRQPMEQTRGLFCM